MSPAISRDRAARFNSSATELWRIGDVFSHPPPHVETFGSLEAELLRYGYRDEMRAIDGRHISWFLEERSAHPRHVAMISEFGDKARLSHDELLAIVCYTGTDAYRDVRRSAAARDWSRWPTFIANLTRALRKLQEFDMRNNEPLQPVFHGISNATTQGDHGGGEQGFWLKFMMPISATPDRDIALSFVDSSSGAKNQTSNSLLLRFEPPFRDEILGPSLTYFADISWLSQFPLEREVLIFPVGDCMGGKFLNSFRLADCNIREFKAGFSGDW